MRWHRRRLREQPVVEVNVMRIPEVVVRHDVHRHIPRPTVMKFIVKDMQGNPYMHAADLSFKYGSTLTFPLNTVTGQVEDLGKFFTIQVDLDYDPKDRT